MLREEIMVPNEDALVIIVANYGTKWRCISFVYDRD
jgi:hypothetical protein